MADSKAELPEIIQRCRVLNDFVKVNKSIVIVIMHKNKQANLLEYLKYI